MNKRATALAMLTVAIMVFAGAGLMKVYSDESDAAVTFQVDGVTYEVIDQGTRTAKVVSTSPSISGNIPSNQDVNPPALKSWSAI